MSIFADGEANVRSTISRSDVEPIADMKFEG